MRDERSLASSLNPDAGRHDITTDPRLVAAAEAATRRSFEEFPYYEMRYGARGRAFGLSDGAWLARLCEGDESDADAQIRWLGRVLAARGMPQILLERFLEVLAEEAEFSSRLCRVLKRGAAGLRRMRLSAISEKRSKEIARAFDASGGGAVPNFGVLVASALADEKNGVPAVAALKEWATDASRFDERWIAAVRAALKADAS